MYSPQLVVSPCDTLSVNTTVLEGTVDSAVAPTQIRLAHEQPFTLGAIEVRPSTREVIAGDERQVIEPRVMHVLVALHRRRGEVVSRDDLIMMCWNGRVVGDDAINRSIARVRRLAETYGGFELETIPRVGYRLVETVLPSSVPVDAIATEPPLLADVAPNPPRFDRRMAAALFMLIAAASMVTWFVVQPRKTPPLQATTDKLIAVLPFTPLYSGGNAQRLGDSTAATVSDTLSKIGQHVVPPTESFQFRGPAKARAAHVLRAAYVIDGEVSREGHNVSVSVRVEDTATGATILARKFEAPANQAEALPDRVAASIAAMSWGYEFADPRLRISGWMKVYDLEQHGELFAAYQNARAMAKKLPNSSPAQVAYAAEAVNLFYAGQATRNPGLIAEARAAEKRAVELNPGNGDAYGLFASTTPAYLWGEREGYIRQALTHSPDSIGAAGYLLWLLNESGHFRDAEPFADSINERFPYEFFSFARPIVRLLGLGNSTDAMVMIARARRLWPDNVTFLSQNFEATAFSGDLPGAEALLQDQEAMSHLPYATVKTWRDVVHALKTGHPNDIRALGSDCASPGEEWWVCMVAFAELGRLDSAFRIADAVYPDQRGANRAALEQKWVAVGIPSTLYLFLPATAKLRVDPRFRDTVDRVGLLPYWKTTHHAPDFCAIEHAPVCALLK